MPSQRHRISISLQLRLHQRDQENQRPQEGLLRGGSLERLPQEWGSLFLRPMCPKKQNAKDTSLQMLSCLKGLFKLNEESRRWQEVYWDFDGTLTGTPKSYTTWADACSAREDSRRSDVPSRSVCPDLGLLSPCMQLLLVALGLLHRKACQVQCLPCLSVSLPLYPK